MQIDLNKYSERFSKLVQLKKIIGLDLNSGLYGNLRNSIHTVEESLVGSDELMTSMLMLRRYEKDFMLRRDVKYFDKFNKEIGDFIEIANNSSTKRYDIVKNINAYQKDFKLLVSNEIKIGINQESGIHGEMRRSIHSMELNLSKSQEEIKIMIESKIASSNNLLMLTISVLALFLMGIIYYLGTSIYRPLESFKLGIIDIIDTKNLKSRLNFSNNDEIGEIANSFDKLLETLQ